MGRGGPSSNLKIQRQVMESNNPSLTAREEEIARLMQHLGNDQINLNRVCYHLIGLYKGSMK